MESLDSGSPSALRPCEEPDYSPDAKETLPPTPNWHRQTDTALGHTTHTHTHVEGKAKQTWEEEKFLEESNILSGARSFPGCKVGKESACQ